MIYMLSMILVIVMLIDFVIADGNADFDVGDGDFGFCDSDGDPAGDVILILMMLV